MEQQIKFSRRTAIAGGLSAALVGCDNLPSGSSGEGFAISEENLAKGAAAFLTIAVLAGAGGFLGGAIRLGNLARGAAKVAALANRGTAIAQSIGTVNRARASQSVRPASGTTVPPANVLVNDFEEVPVLGRRIELDLAELIEQGGSFGNFDVFSTVLPTSATRPMTFAQALGNGDYPAVRLKLASNGKFNGKLPVELPFAGSYVSYNWRVPVQDDRPSDSLIASSPLMGPAFLAVDSRQDVQAMASEVRSGVNVEARYRVA